MDVFASDQNIPRKECQLQTVGFGGAQFKKFETKEKAEEFVGNAKLQSKVAGDKSATNPRGKTSTKRPKDNEDSKTEDDNPEANESVSPRKKSKADVADNSKSKTKDSKPVGDPVFAEGICTFQGKKGAVVAVGIFWSKDSPNNYSETVNLIGKPTNNRAEIHAAIQAVNQAKQLGKTAIVIHSSNSFLIQSMRQWHTKWKKNDWKTSSGSEVTNKSDIVELSNAVQGITVNWVLTGPEDEEKKNEAVQLAKKAAKK